MDWTGLVKHGLVNGGLVKHGVVNRELVRRGLVNHGLVKRGLVKRGLVKRGLVKRNKINIPRWNRFELLIATFRVQYCLSSSGDEVDCLRFKLCLKIHVFPIQRVDLRTERRSSHGKPCLRGYC